VSRDFDARLSGRKLGGEGVCFYLFFSDSGGIDECLLDRWGSLLSLRASTMDMQYRGVTHG
jgi:hypothetical protein